MNMRHLCSIFPIMCLNIYLYVKFLDDKIYFFSIPCDYIVTYYNLGIKERFSMFIVERKKSKYIFNKNIYKNKSCN